MLAFAYFYRRIYSRACATHQPLSIIAASAMSAMPRGRMTGDCYLYFRGRRTLMPADYRYAYAPDLLFSARGFLAMPSDALHFARRDIRVY